MGPADRPEGLVRPFLNRGPRPASANESFDPQAAESGAPSVRSYMITGGRTHAEGVALEFESILSVTRLGANRVGVVPFERGKILQLCFDGQYSVAEVAAHLRVPIGVTKVLCADLINDGMLEASGASADVANDVSLLTRLIQGVRAL